MDRWLVVRGGWCLEWIAVRGKWSEKTPVHAKDKKGKAEVTTDRHPSRITDRYPPPAIHHSLSTTPLT